ncbi:unnamed protein product [Aphanomyces euteiches]
MELELELRRNLAEINAALDQRTGATATPSPSTATVPSTEGGKGETPLHAKDLVAKLKSWTQSGQLQSDQLRLHELLAYVAEVAVREDDFATANECVRWFLVLAYPRDQFYCRLLFVRAKCIAHDAKSMQGQPYIDQLQYAIHWILQVVKLALETTSRPHYDFLVYNASITYWRVARPLMRPGTARHLVESLQVLVDGLKTVNDKDKGWLARLHIALAHAYEDDSQLTKGGKAINDAVDLATALIAAVKADTTATEAIVASSSAMTHAVHLLEEASLVQIHLARHKDAECAKGLATAKKNLVSKRHVALLNLQSIKSSLTPVDGIRAALVDLFTSATGLKIDAFWTETTAPPPIPDDGSVDWETLVEVGMLAVQHHHVDVGRVCDKVLSSSKRLTPSVRILTDLLRCCLLLQQDDAPDTIESAKRDPPLLDQRQREAQRLARHVDCVKVLERSLTAAKRVGHAHLIHEICVLAWNVALPLLEPHLRKHVHRLFQTATTLLEEIESPLVDLRAQMHFETAKCEIAADYLAKASVHVNKALALDYGTVAAKSTPPPPVENLKKTTSSLSVVGVASSGETAASARVLDKHLLPLKRCLDLKANIYQEPDAVDDQALLLLEQAKDAHDKNLKVTLLGKAIDILDLNPLADAPDDAAAALSRFQLWHRMALMAWQHRQIPMTRKAAAKAVQFSFPKQFSAAIQQGGLHFILAESFAADIQAFAAKISNAAALRLGLAMPKDDKSTTTHTSAAAADAMLATILACKKSLIAQVALGLQVGVDANVPWMVENAARYLWNYHLHLFRPDSSSDCDLDCILPELTAALEAAFQALAANDASDGALLSCFAQALTKIRRRHGQINEIDAVLDAVLRRGDSLPLCHRKALVELKTQSQLDRAAKDPIVGDTTPLKVVSCLQAAEIHLDLASAPTDDEKALLDKAAGFYQRAATQWTAIPPPSAAETSAKTTTLELELQSREFNAEVHVRLAKAALALHKTNDAQKYCEAAVAPLQAANLPPQYMQKSILRWYSMAQLVWAQAVMQLADATEANERDVKHELALFAIQHVVVGADFGVRCGMPALVQNAARLFWNATTDVLDTAAAPDPRFRQQLIAPMHAMLDHFAAALDGEMEFRVEFVCALLDVYEELGEWANGLSTVEAAFQVVPPSFQRSLWRYRVLFLSKLGKSVHDGGGGGGMAKMKETDALLQARVTKRMAAASTDLSTQYKALVRAVKEVDGRVEQAQFLVDVAEWFYANHLSLDDVHDQLHGRILHLVGVLTAFLGALNMLLPLFQPSAAATTTRQQLKSSKKNKRQDDEPSLEWWHLDSSLRILVMLAMAARSFDERLEYILAALGHVHAIWQALEEELFVLQCRQAYAAAAAAVDTAPKEEFETWKSQTTVTKSFVVPESTQAWSSMDWESALPALCGHAPLGKTSKVLLHAANVTQPTLSLFYVMKLVDFAMKFHQEPHAVPCLVLAKALSASSSASSAATTWTELPLTPILVDLKLAMVFDQLGYIDGGQTCLKRVIDAFRLAHDSDGGAAAAALKKEEPLEVSTRRHRVVLSSRPNLMALSAKVVEHLLDLGFHAQAKRLLELTAMQCAAAGDLTTLAQVDFCRGQLCLAEGHVAAALHHFQMACEVDGLDVISYAKYISTYAAALGRHGQLKLAKGVLQQAIAAVTELPKLPPLSPIQRQLVPSAAAPPLFVDLDIVDALATLRAAYAARLAEESAQAHATGSEWAPLWAESMRHFADSVADLERVGGNFNMAAIATTWGHLVASKQRGDFVADAKDALEFVFQARDAFQQAHAYVESVWMKMDTAPPLPSSCAGDSRHANVVLAQVVAAAKANCASMELLRVRLAQEETMVVTRIEHEAKKTLVELWLDATAPKKAKTRDDMVVPPLENALLYWNGALNLSPAPLYAAGIGQCLRRQLQDEAAGEASAAVWSFAKEEQRKLGVACATSSPATAAAAPLPVDPRQVDCIRFLQETLDAAVKQRDRDAIQACCLELVECFGTRDVASAVKYLLWYQSCRMSVVAEQLFLQACDATNRTALFIHRARNLPPTSVPAQLAHVFLEHESEAWRRLGVFTPMEQVLSSVPPLCVLVSLQFSPDMDYLYGAIRGSAATPPANAASNAAATAGAAGVHVIARMEFHRPRRLALLDLVAKWKAWRASTVKSLLQYGEAMPSSAAMDAFELTASSSEDVLETQFQALLDETRALLAPLLDALVPSLAKALPPTTTTASASNSAADDTASTVVLLVDAALESIPWEALVDAVDSRDFSAHFLSTRWNNLKATPFKREDFFYVADPYHDDHAADGRHSIAGRKSIREIAMLMEFVETLHSLKTHLHGLKGVSGTDYVPSASEWQHALTSRRGGGFLFYGPNRSLAHFAPALLAGLQATKCNLVVAMSRMETDASFRRQSKLDTHKSKRQLMLEDGYESALLWSLAGVNCVVTNQWNTSFAANHRVVSSLFAWMAKNIPIAKAVKRMGADADKADAKGASNNAVALKGRVRFCPIVYGVPHLG